MLTARLVAMSWVLNLAAMLCNGAAQDPKNAAPAF
jgi:hypothetical protein